MTEASFLCDRPAWGSLSREPRTGCPINGLCTVTIRRPPRMVRLWRLRWARACCRSHRLGRKTNGRTAGQASTLVGLPFRVRAPVHQNGRSPSPGCSATTQDIAKIRTRPAFLPPELLGRKNDFRAEPSQLCTGVIPAVKSLARASNWFPITENVLRTWSAHPPC